MYSKDRKPPRNKPAVFGRKEYVFSMGVASWVGGPAIRFLTLSARTCSSDRMESLSFSTGIRNIIFGLLVAVGGWVRAASIADSAGYAVRLCVSTGDERVKIQGRQITIIDGDVHDVLTREVDGAIEIDIGKHGLQSRAFSHTPRSIVIESQNAFVVKGRRLVGKLEVRNDAKQKLLIVNHLPLEKYLQGILVAEMAPNWPLEALKAQAVASRTYAVYKILSNQEQAYDVSSTTLDQVYRGIADESVRVTRAVLATRGKVLVYANRPAEALFHSCCGGRTRSAESVFGNPVAYLIAVEDRDCEGCPREFWRTRIGLRQLAARVGGNLKKPVAVKQVRHAGDGIELVFQNHASTKLTNHKLRRLLGERVLWSPGFTWRLEGADMVFEGRGNGHGVGMCQWGARAMAERGRGYREILTKYYPGCKLRAMF